MLVKEIGADLAVQEHQPEEQLDRQVVVEEQEINLNGVQYIDGKNWTVDYYRQVLTKNDQAHNLDPSLPDGEQQYYKYNKMNIKVTDPITMDALQNISGAGILLPIIPNIGDVFITDIQEGKRAMFVITEVTKKTYVSNTVYEITYHVDTYQTLDPVKFEVLERRVVKEYFYNDVDSLGEKPIITSEEQTSYIDAKKTFYKIEKDMIRLFASEENYLWVKKDDYVYFNYEVNNLFGFLSERYFHTYKNKELDYITPITLMVERDINLFNRLDNVGYVANNTFSPNQYAIRLMSVIERYPDYYIRKDGEFTSDYIATTKYLFSDAFYNRETLTGIEKLVMDYIEYKAIDHDILRTVVNDYYSMSDFDKYHYGAIILLLLKEYWRNV